MIGLLILLAVAAGAIIALISGATIYRVTHPPRLTYAVALARQLPTSPAELGLPFLERQFRLPDGMTTPGWIIHGSQLTGPVIVLTHGWGDSRYGTLGWAKLLAPLASSVVLYDLRGQGESPYPRSHLGTTEVDDLLAIVDQVEAGRRPVVLLGASMGAGISIAAAAQAPRRIAGVIGEGAYRHGMEPIVGFFRINKWPVLPFYLPVGLHLWFWYTSPARFDRAGHAAKLQCPLLLLHGTADPISPCASAEQIARAAPRGKLERFDGGGHLDLAACDPGRYLAAIEGFLKALA